MEEKQILCGGGSEGGSFQVVAAPGAGCPHLSTAGMLLVPTKERTCPSTADQQAALRDRNPLSFSECVPSARHTAGT